MQAALLHHGSNICTSGGLSVDLAVSRLAEPCSKTGSFVQRTQPLGSMLAGGRRPTGKLLACCATSLSARTRRGALLALLYTSSCPGQALTVGVLFFLPGGPAPVAHSSGVDQAGHPAATIRARPRRGAVSAPAGPPARARHARRLPVLHVRLCPVFSFPRFACPSPDGVRASHAPAHVCGHVDSDATTKPVAKHYSPLMQQHAPRAICKKVGEPLKWQICALTLQWVCKLCSFVKGLWIAARRSVPSGRVGNAKDAIFRSNEHFREAVGERENLDVQARSLPACSPAHDELSNSPCPGS